MTLRHSDHTDARAIAGLYPDLLRIARGELFNRHLDLQLDEEWATERTASTAYGRPTAADRSSFEE